MNNLFSLRRDHKLFVDRDGLSKEEAAEKLRSKTIRLAIGQDVCGSRTLQAALLTASNVAARWCLNVEIDLPSGFKDNLTLKWFDDSILRAIKAVAPEIRATSEATASSSTIIIGSRPDIAEGLQITFDGWVGAVTNTRTRLPERERCVLAGVLAGSLAVSEVFLSFAGVTVEAERRSVGVSLWRPELSPDDDNALGPNVDFLPSSLWLLGLGHLGQAYLWALSLMPYKTRSNVHLYLQDFDVVEDVNLGTQVLTSADSIGSRKTRVCGNFLQGLGFNPTYIERKFDHYTRRNQDDPSLALCGFDGNGPRHVLDTSGFERVVECGVGGTHHDFDALKVHSMPIPGTTALSMWPPTDNRASVLAEEMAATRRVYQEVERLAGCGHVELAGKAVAIPFVGMIGASFVLAEVLRMLHDGERYSTISLQLSSPDDVKCTPVEEGYRGRNIPKIDYSEAEP